MKEKKMAKKMGKPSCKRKFKKKIVIAAAITTLSAFAIKALLKPKAELSCADFKEEEKSEFEIVLDGLVADGTINKEQHVIIQTAIVAAIQASMADEYLKSGECLGGTPSIDTIIDSIIGKFTKLKDSLFEKFPL